MELIEALEQLSLRVRCQERKDISSNAGTSRPARVSQAGLFGQQIINDNRQPGPTTAGKWHENETYCYDEDVHLKQLKDFDSSLETLISQISDLDHKTQETESTRPNTNVWPNANSTRPHDLYLLRRKRFHNSIYGCNSMETSQEEDSDSSSQFSSNVDSASLASQPSATTSSRTHPLVSHLMKRDLSAITDTVRRIGRILAIGNQLEDISKICDTQYLHDRGSATSLYELCSEFGTLCSGVPYIYDLPTIKRYSECCRIVLNHLDGLTLTSGETRDGKNVGRHAIDDDSSSMMMTDDDDDKDEEEDCEEAAMLAANQSSLNSWTNNKLYNGLD